MRGNVTATAAAAAAAATAACHPSLVNQILRPHVLPASVAD